MTAPQTAALDLVAYYRHALGPGGTGALSPDLVWSDAAMRAISAAMGYREPVRFPNNPRQALGVLRGALQVTADPATKAAIAPHLRAVAAVCRARGGRG